MQHSILTLSLFEGFCERIEILPYLKEYVMRAHECTKEGEKVWLFTVVEE